MSNKKLIFTHEIPVELYAHCDINLTVLVNNQTMFVKQYSAREIHNEVIKFDHEYKESKKNVMTFLFSGEKEVEKKYLKILQICLNKQMVNKYNAEYLPEINPEWWEQLSQDEKEKQNEIIYGKTGAEFGWYGEINFYYCAGFDYQAKLAYSENNKTDITKLLGEKINWVFIDENSTSPKNLISTTNGRLTRAYD